MISSSKAVGQVHYIFYFHTTRILLTGLTNWMSKIPHLKAFIFTVLMTVRDIVKAISIEID